ncbi:MAG: GntR family transcriptional regulator, partial [Burkholderiales bacterium PBB5]
MTEPAAGTGWDSHVHVFDAQAPVRAGHYQPVHRPLQQVQALAEQHGVRHLVLVQPSVYGCDNRALLDALREGHGGSGPAAFRGVVVPAPQTSDAQLAAMHALGVRGIRLNLVNPAVLSVDAALALCARTAALGWHLQLQVVLDAASAGVL